MMSTRARVVRHHRRRWWWLSPVLVAMIALVTSAPAFAQDGADTPTNQPSEGNAAPATSRPDPRRELASPRATMFTFLEAIGAYNESGADDDDALERAVSTMNLSEVAEERADEIAIQLWGILNRIGEVRPEFLPDRALVAARELERFSYYPLDMSAVDMDYPPLGMFEENGFAKSRDFDRAGVDERVVFTRDAATGEWRFSADTIAGVTSFYRAVEDLDPVYGDFDERQLSFALWLRSQMPASLRNNEFLALEYWQWIGLLVVIFLGVLIDFLTRAVMAVVSRRVIARQRGEASDESIAKLARPIGLVVAGVFWLWAIRALALPDLAFVALLVAVRLITMVAGVWAAFRLTDLAGEVLASKALHTDTKFDDLLVPLVRKTLKVFIAAFGLIYIADSFDIEILPLLTGLGIGGAALAFASKDTVENFFGSIAVIVDRPFEVGDWVVIGDTEGTVETMGFRSTRVRTFYNSEITLPNANLVRAVVDNYGRRKYRRWKTHVSVTYDTPPERVDAFAEGIREIIRLHPYTRKDYYQVWLHQFSASSIDVLVYMFFEAPDWSTELRERHRLMLDIMRLARELEVEFAFPTQTLYLKRDGEDEDDDESPGAATTGGGGGGGDQRSLDAGRRAAQRLTRSAGWREKKPGAYEFTHSTPIDPDDETQIESRVGGDG
ncbi:MAG: mechanosensitive ion channel family protein [Phycisphaerales bacterium]